MTGKDLWRRNEPDSPCVKICLIHPKERLCTGCLRSIEEISIWSQLSPEARKTLMQELPARQAAFHKRQGGRGARLKKSVIRPRLDALAFLGVKSAQLFDHFLNFRPRKF